MSYRLVLSSAKLPSAYFHILHNLIMTIPQFYLSNTVIEDWSYELEETEETGIGNISNDNAGTSKHHLFGE